MGDNYSRSQFLFCLCLPPATSPATQSKPLAATRPALTCAVTRAGRSWPGGSGTGSPAQPRLLSLAQGAQLSPGSSAQPSLAQLSTGSPAQPHEPHVGVSPCPAMPAALSCPALGLSRCWWEEMGMWSVGTWSVGTARLSKAAVGGVGAPGAGRWGQVDAVPGGSLSCCPTDRQPHG